MTLAAIIGTIASLGFIVGLSWFAASIVMTVLPRWWQRGVYGVKRSLLLIVVAYVGTLMFNHPVIA